MINPPYWPRGLKRKDAAAYIGVSARAFDSAVRRGVLPKPFKVGHSPLWDRLQLDDALDKISGRELSTEDWDALADKAL